MRCLPLPCVYLFETEFPTVIFATGKFQTCISNITYDLFDKSNVYFQLLSTSRSRRANQFSSTLVNPLRTISIFLIKLIKKIEFTYFFLHVAYILKIWYLEISRKRMKIRSLLVTALIKFHLTRTIYTYELPIRNDVRIILRATVSFGGYLSAAT